MNTSSFAATFDVQSGTTQCFEPNFEAGFCSSTGCYGQLNCSCLSKPRTQQSSGRLSGTQGSTETPTINPSVRKGHGRAKLVFNVSTDDGKIRTIDISGWRAASPPSPHFGRLPTSTSSVHPNLRVKRGGTSNESGGRGNRGAKRVGAAALHT